MLKLSQTDQPTNRPTNQPTDRAKTYTNERAISFNLWQNFIGTNLLTKFHEDWSINVANIVSTRQLPPPPGGHVFQRTITIFKLTRAIVRTHVLIKFHQDLLTRKNATPPCGHFHEHWMTNVISRVLTRFYHTCPAPWRPCFSFNWNQDIIGTHVLTKFHEDRTKNENCHAPWRLCFQPTETIFELVQDIIATHVLTKVLTRKTATPPGGHVFQQTGTIFELVQDIIGTHVLTKKTATTPGGHVFQSTETIFELFQEFIGTHVPPMTSRVLTRKTATPPVSHVFQPTQTIFELVQDIIETHVLIKFHEDWTINVTFRVLTR
ncbi:hypothetical protein DPMN_101162 [Dreissena polymorpha]|uniref:Uncharacterized protein n=1 Tax=Dreissena polymorpha TaxID=45954 RepID=A0A9D4LKK7_DREPO|nr:hypothetical protein DPMN_101162 [Dreissena polymorpha]